ncbi:glycosyltransferase family 4 protein [Raineyella sp.]|uniref:glycosyltransferase family 4 protein n=1 Tax=Raineyella sp. TaxID=1911550 RepID=UPI002B208196|nr:glycosyltransferase family 4 protein [Raineyella sp.]MEA5153892.1 glycosyltransferase family 4 protein [Raineyella sp.]
MSASPPVVFLNNSRETFTPTRSGAIATCLVEVGRSALAAGTTPVVISRGHAEEPRTYDWPDLRLVDPIGPAGPPVVERARRVRRRLNGWARPDQWQYAREIVPLLREIAPRAVLLSNDPELAVHLRGRFPGLRVVHWFHNLELSSDRFRRAYAADRGIVSVAVSRYLARAIENVYRLQPLSVHASLNGVDAAAFRCDERPTRIPVIGHLGRVGIEKGLDVLLDAARILHARGAQFAVQLVGDTNWGEHHENPFSAGVGRQIAELAAAGVDVRRLGHVPRSRIPAALAGSDIHVVPSRWDEPCGLTTLEGLASGQPVVGSATGGTPEVLAGAGLLFPREDPVALADVLEPLVRDADVRRLWGARAAARAAALPWSATWRCLEEALIR